MRYYYEPSGIPSTHQYGQIHWCTHHLYDSCTLYLIGNKGLAVVREEWQNKCRYYTHLDTDLANDIYVQPGFKDYFEKHAAEPEGIYGDIYPTVHVRKLMYALKMKPLKPEFWEKGI